jgi:hypothetical protein
MNEKRKRFIVSTMSLFDVAKVSGVRERREIERERKRKRAIRQLPTLLLTLLDMCPTSQRRCVQRETEIWRGRERERK